MTTMTTTDYDDGWRRSDKAKDCLLFKKKRLTVYSVQHIHYD